MKTLSKIVFSIWEQLENFNITDDSPYSEEFVEDTVIEVNNTLIREAFRNHELSSYLYLTDTDLPVKEFSHSIVIDGVLFENTSDYCYVDINPLIQKVEPADIVYFGNVGLTLKYTRKSLGSFLKGARAIKWKINKPSYVLVGDRIIIKKDANVGKFAEIRALFTDPRKVSGYDPKKPFPTPSEYKLELLTLQQLLSTKNIPWDMRQDGQRTIIVPKQAPTQKQESNG